MNLFGLTIGIALMIFISIILFMVLLVLVLIYVSNYNSINRLSIKILRHKTSGLIYI